VVSFHLPHHLFVFLVDGDSISVFQFDKNSPFAEFLFGQKMTAKKVKSNPSNKCLVIVYSLSQ
jgi:hypothetical protein